MMNMKTLALGIGFALATSVGAMAAPTLSIEIYDGATLIGSTSAVSGGRATVIASSGNFADIVISTQGVPYLKSPNLASQSIQATTQDTFSGPTTLTVKITQQGLTDFPEVRLANTFTGNTLTSNGAFTTFTIANYYDSSNAAFGTGTLMAMADYSGGGIDSFKTGPITVDATPGALFSETTIYTITFTDRQSSISGSAQIVNVPEPMSVAVFGAGLLGLGLTRRPRKQG